MQISFYHQFLSIKNKELNPRISLDDCQFYPLIPGYGKALQCYAPMRILTASMCVLRSIAEFIAIRSPLVMKSKAKE